MITKSGLLKWLHGIDKRLKKKITIVAVGGTAMTLLGLKPSTIDIDLCINSKDKKELEKALDKKFRVDIFTDGFIFSEQLPSDYVKKSKEILELKHLMLKALSPVDIVITKAARLNARDEEDIGALAKYVEKDELIKRFNDVVETYAGDVKVYRYNFEVVLKRFFK